MGAILKKHVLAGLLFLVIAANGLAQRDTGPRDFDRRDIPAGTVDRLTPLQLRARAAMAARAVTLQAFVAARQELQPGLRVTANRYGLPKLMLREGQALTAPTVGDPETIARNFLGQNSTAFGR